MNGIKKGTPLKSEAVPAAVSPGCKLQPFLLNYKATVSFEARREGISKRDKPEDLP